MISNAVSTKLITTKYERRGMRIGNQIDTPAFRSARHATLESVVWEPCSAGAERRSASANYSKRNRERSSHACDFHPDTVGWRRRHSAGGGWYVIGHMVH